MEDGHLEATVSTGPSTSSCLKIPTVNRPQSVPPIKEGYHELKPPRRCPRLGRSHAKHVLGETLACCVPAAGTQLA